MIKLIKTCSLLWIRFIRSFIDLENSTFMCALRCTFYACFVCLFISLVSCVYNISAIMPREATFFGSEYLSYDLSQKGEPVVSTNDKVIFQFKTQQSNGLIVYTGKYSVPNANHMNYSLFIESRNQPLPLIIIRWSYLPENNQWSGVDDWTLLLKCDRKCLRFICPFCLLATFSPSPYEFITVNQLCRFVL